MGFLKAVYNLIMGIIGLIVIGFLAYVFILSEWYEYEERQHEEDRAELIDSFTEDLRERGLGDLDELKQEYLTQCQAHEMVVLEGDAASICPTMADVLLAQSQERGITLSDRGELGYRLCALDAEYWDEDPEGFCDRQEEIDQTLSDAIAYSLCEFDTAWLYVPDSETQIAKRGPAVYTDHELRVDCDTGLFHEWEYDGFFDSVAWDEDEELPQVIDQLYDALDMENDDQVIAVLDSHAFGEDEEVDQWVVNMLLDDVFIDLIPEVLSRNGNKVNFDIGYYDQPLSEAIDGENLKVALYLLNAGADPVRPSDYGNAPIVDAAGYGMLDVVKELVARGADVNGVVGSETLDFGEPLRWASWNGHEETVLWLLQNGATIAPENPSKYPRWSADTLLNDAVAGGSFPVIQALVQMGAKSDEPLRLFEGAMAGGNPDVLELLFSQGYELPETEYHDRIYDGVVDVVQEEGRGRAEHGVRMFEMLLDRGLDMSSLSDSGWNYGHQAVIHYSPPVVRTDDDDRKAVVYEHRLRFVKRVVDEVLEDGVDVDQRYEGNTMLMEAADNGQPELVRHLLDRGADATLKNDDGRSALDIAVREGRRMTRIWDEDETMKSRFSEVIEILGGDPDSLDVTEEAVSES